MTVELLELERKLGAYHLLEEQSQAMVLVVYDRLTLTHTYRT